MWPTQSPTTRCPADPVSYLLNAQRHLSSHTLTKQRYKGACMACAEFHDQVQGWPCVPADSA